MDHPTSHLHSIPSQEPPPRDASAVVVPPQVAHYRLVRRLGRGGMGVVYEGVHLHLKRRVAIKLLIDAPQAATGRLQRFEREMETIGLLHHPHIVQAHDAGCDGGLHYLVMEFVEGCDLQAVVRAAGALSPGAACACIQQAALGLQYAHTHRCVHRDIKPSNLLLSVSGVVRVADLGLARLQAAPPERALTMTGQVLGTVDFMSPEQARGQREVGSTSDIYSLGCTLYYLLVGRVPFHGQEYDSLARKLMAHIEEPLPRLEEAGVEVPPAVIELLDAMTAKEPSLRPSAAEVAERLETIADASPLPAMAALALEHRQQAEAAGDGGAVTMVDRSGSTDQPASTGTPLATADGVRAAPGEDRGGRRIKLPRALLALALGGAVAMAAAGLWPEDEARIVQPPDHRAGAQPDRPDPIAVAPPPQLPPREPYYEELTADQIVHSTLYPLLNVEPQRMFWGNHPLSRVSFDPKLKQVHATDIDAGLLVFGSAPRVGYTLQMDIYQNRWPAGVGVFFGLQPLDEPGPKGERQWKSQVLFLQERIVGPKLGEFPLEMIRAKWTIRQTEAGDFVFLPTDYRSVRLPNPGLRSQQFEISIGQYGLRSVRWGGDAEIGRDLCDPEVNQEFTPNDYCGGFGGYVFNSEGTFRNARIQFDAPIEVPP